jgi:hypothetical protein
MMLQSCISKNKRGFYIRKKCFDFRKTATSDTLYNTPDLDN